MADLGTEALRTAVIQALRDLIKAETEIARDDVLEAMLAARRSGIPIKSLDVKLPDGRIVAAITLVDGSDEVVVVDRPKFTAWVRHRAPEMVVDYDSPIDRVAQIIRVHSPEVGGQTGAVEAEKWTRAAALAVLAELGVDPETPDPRVSRSYETALLASLVPVEAYDPALPSDPDSERDPGAVEPDSGEIVPGVAYVPAGDPTKIQMNYKPTSEKGRAAIAEAWRTGRLPAIEGLPGIEAS